MNRIPIYERNGNGRHLPSAGMSQGSLELAAKSIADRIVNAMLPSLTPIVKKAAEASEPTIRTVIREEVMPKVGLYTVLGLGVVALVSTVIALSVYKKR